MYTFLTCLISAPLFFFLVYSSFFKENFHIQKYESRQLKTSQNELKSQADLTVTITEVNFLDETQRMSANTLFCYTISEERENSETLESWFEKGDIGDCLLTCTWCVMCTILLLMLCASAVDAWNLHLTYSWTSLHMLLSGCRWKRQNSTQGILLSHHFQETLVFKKT